MPSYKILRLNFDLPDSRSEKRATVDISRVVHSDSARFATSSVWSVGNTVIEICYRVGGRQALAREVEIDRVRPPSDSWTGKREREFAFVFHVEQLGG